MQFLLPYIGNRKGILPGNIPSPPPALQSDMGNQATDDFQSLDAVNVDEIDDPGIPDEGRNTADEDFSTAVSAPVPPKKKSGSSGRVCNGIH